ncbi:MAG: enoyl-CoA hydratase [Hyphomonadaceae bacterium]
MPDVLVDREDGYAVVTFNRPDKLNALSTGLRREFTAALSALDADDSVRAIVLTGAGERAFTAGMDLKEFETNPNAFQDGAKPECDLGRALDAFSKPIILAVNGLAITGGMEILVNCDCVIAAEHARFADTHVRVGLLPGWGLSARLSRLVGPARAKQISLTGNFVDARRAFEWGLVNEVLPAQEVLARAKQLAADMAQVELKLLRAYKKLIKDGFEMTVKDALALERRSAKEYAASVSNADIAANRLTAQKRARGQLD